MDRVERSGARFNFEWNNAAPILIQRPGDTGEPKMTTKAVDEKNFFFFLSNLSTR